MLSNLVFAMSDKYISCAVCDCCTKSNSITSCCHISVCSLHKPFTCECCNEEFCIACINAGNGYLCDECNKFYCDEHNSINYVCNC